MKQFFFILLCPLLILTSCEKEKDPPPITSEEPCKKTIFECKINGEPFTFYHEYPCYGLSVFYDSVQYGLDLVGTDCRLWRNEYRTIGFRAPEAGGEGEFPIQFANVAYITDQGHSNSHNKVIEGNVNLINLKNPTNDQSNYNGYAQGTFWFTVYGEESGDTIKVTDGKFCVEL